MPPTRRTFLALWIANFATAIGILGFLPLFPLVLRQELGMTDEASVRLWSGILTAAAPLAAVPVAGFWGALGDRVGFKPMLLRANLAVTVFVALMAASSSVGMLLVARIGQGLFSGFRMAPAMTLLSMMTADERQGRATGRLHVAMIGGGLIGPVIGGLLGDTLGLRWTFVVGSALALLGTVLIAAFVHEPARPHPARPGGADGAGAGPDVPAGPVSLQGAEPRLAPRSRVRLAAHVRGAARETLGWRAFGLAALGGVLVVAFLTRLGGSLVEPVLALYVEALGAPAEHLATIAGVVFAATPLAAVLCAPLWGGAGDRLGHRRLLVLCAVGTGLLVLPQAAVGGVIGLAALRFGAAAFQSGITPTAIAAATRGSERGRRGRSHGQTYAALGLAHGLGMLTGGALAAAIGLRPLFVVAGGLMLVAAAGLLAREARARLRTGAEAAR